MAEAISRTLAFLVAFIGSLATAVVVIGGTKTEPDPPPSSPLLTNLLNHERHLLHTLQSVVLQGKNLLPHRLSQFKDSGVNEWGMVAIASCCGLIPVIWFVRRKLLHERTESSTPLWSRGPTKSGRGSAVSRNDGASINTSDATITDPGLLKKHSEYRSFTTPIHGFTYPEIRVFYRPHPQANELPTEPKPLPLLVFIHGLGGSIAQFHPLLISLINLAPCLSIDLPGCGLSKFAPNSWDAYTIGALTELLEVAIASYRTDEQEIVLIGHSLGCSLSALLASKSSRSRSHLNVHVAGLIAMCPKAEPPSAKETKSFRFLLRVPGSVFDLWRRWDRRGGTESASVARFVGKDADTETKRLQLRFNEQSRTPVWRRMAYGTLPKYDIVGVPNGGLPGRAVWAGLEIPVFLIAGEADIVTKPEEVEKIAAFLGKSGVTKDSSQRPRIPDTAAPVNTSVLERVSHIAADPESSEKSNSASDGSKSETSGLDRKKLKTIVLPLPASHALPYTTSTSRIVAGLITDFLASHVSPRLSLGWQLQYLSTEGKWDVKNLEKWKKVLAVSEPIGGVFRAIKTLREVDERHRPEIFVKEWGENIKDIVDISHESPVYDPRGLEKGGIRYHKFPTVSKIPPTDAEVDEFVNLIDRLVEERNAAEQKEGVPAERHALIGVHCHYGYNRTGYFIVAYLVDRCGYRLQTAIDEFEAKKPPGIKHIHFINALHVRYCVGLKRRPTL